MSDEEPTLEERREAEALARVLEGGGDAQGIDDALSAAALLRYARRPELDPQRARAIREQLLDAQSPRRRARVAWLAAPLAVAAALALVWVGGSLRVGREAAPAVSSVEEEALEPPPAREPAGARGDVRAELLEAQARALRGEDPDLALLAQSSRAYRAQWLASLQRESAGAP